MLGISYPGWLTAMALLDPHPALKAVSPQASPADMFLGDDFHHNGAFRLSYGFEYVAMMETDKSNSSFKFDRHDTFEWYLKLGALSNVNREVLQGQDADLERLRRPSRTTTRSGRSSRSSRDLTRVTVPTLQRRRLVRPGGLLRAAQDLRAAGEARQEEPELPRRRPVEPRRLGRRAGRQARQASPSTATPASTSAPRCRRRSSPSYLKDKGERSRPRPCMFQTGTNKWVELRPLAAEERRDAQALLPPRRQARVRPAGRDDEAAFDEYVSDPANPVPYRPRPVTPTYPGPEWQVWMVEDQRFTHHRPDVLTYETEPLTEDVTVAGSMTAQLFAATTGHRLRLDRAPDRRLSRRSTPKDAGAWAAISC